MAVRTTRFAAGRISGAAGDYFVYTVPSGVVALLKSVSIRNAGAAVSQWGFGGNIPGGTVSCDYFGRGAANTMAVGESQTTAGFWALLAADRLYIHLAVTSTLDYWLSGAVLS